MGAKQGRAKGNKQKAEYTEPERRHGKPGREEGEKPGKREWNRSTGKATCEAGTGREWKRKNRWLSSEALKRKWTKENGSQAPIPEEKSKREAPVEQLWERRREGRKETNRKQSTQNRTECTGNQAGRKRKKRQSESRAEKLKKPTVRQKQWKRGNEETEAE